MKRKRREKGSVTIEAIISLTAFMFFIITILTILDICIVQAKIGMAIQDTAKEISHYTYIYGLTGFHSSKAKIAAGANATSAKLEKGAKDLNTVAEDVNSVFTAVQNLGSNGVSADSAASIKGALEQAGGDVGTLKETFRQFAKDPKQLAMGIAQMCVTNGVDLAASRLIAAPLAAALCEKNLAPEKDGDADAYLKHLGVKPAANGSYLDGLDFTSSTLFAGDTNEIRIVVSYDVKVVALLPIDFSFHFCQCAVTEGWLNGSDSFRSTKEVVANDTLWTQATIKERSDLIRHQGIQDYLDKGYSQVADLSYQDVEVYDPKTKEFVNIRSMNPLYSAEGERTSNLDDINEDVIKEQIELMTNGIHDTIDGKKEVTVKDKNGNKSTQNCEGATATVIIEIPEDPGLKEKLESIAKEADTHGVNVVFQQSYGKGAATSEKGSDVGSTASGGAAQITGGGN